MSSLSIARVIIPHRAARSARLSQSAILFALARHAENFTIALKYGRNIPVHLTTAVRKLPLDFPVHNPHMNVIDYGQTTRLAAFVATLSITSLIEYRALMLRAHN